jgi:hypothetical protein
MLSTAAAAAAAAAACAGRTGSCMTMAPGGRDAERNTCRTHDVALPCFVSFLVGVLLHVTCLQHLPCKLMLLYVGAHVAYLLQS